MLIIGFSSGFCFAQKGPHFGLRTSYNYVGIINPNTYNMNIYQYSHRFGTSIGIIAGYNFLNNLGLQIELNKDSVGSTTVHKTDVIDYSREINLTYRQLPVMLKYMSSGKVAKFYVMAGPQFGKLIKGEVHIDSNSIIKTISDTAFKQKDISLSFGIGGEFYIGKSFYISLSSRSNYGLTDLNHSAVKISNVLHKSTNVYSGVELGLHYLINKKD